MDLYLLKLVIILAIYPSTQALPIAKPNCQDHCGNISIPFPFGTTPDCSLNRRFLVTCNHTTLITTISNFTITDISLDGHITHLHHIAKDCYNIFGSNTYRRNTGTTILGDYFTVNNTANKLTVVGCDTHAYVSGNWTDRKGTKRNYMTGCDAICYEPEDLQDGQCMGLGCCQISVPANVSKLKIKLNSIHNYTEVSTFNDCGFAFYAEVGAFSFSKDSFERLKNVSMLPRVFDWNIGNWSSAEAVKSANSRCYDSNNGNQFRCRCHDGYEGNPYLTDGCQDIDECENGSHDCIRKDYCINTLGNYTCSCPKHYHGDGRGQNGCIKDHSTKIPRILVGIALVTVLLLIARCLYLEFKRRWFEREKQILFHKNGGKLLQEKLKDGEGSADLLKIFTLVELEKATNNFDNSMIVGQGGFGTVYKGLLPDHSTIAIKKSKRVNHDQVDQFINEVIILSQINHRNVVKFLGCCLETEIPHLVYEFVSNGTLSSHIHQHEKACLLCWDKRLKIASEAADVLSYLHSEATTPIIHRDVKSDNILLDDTYTAKVSDFGASRLVPLDRTTISTMVQGTFGYIDPEYFQTNQLTEKSDVYSFGVVLLQLLTGRKAVSFDRPEEEQSLANFCLHMLRRERLFEILDTSINVDEGRNRQEITKVSAIALGCLHIRGEERPSMRVVAMELERLRMGEHSWDQHTIKDVGSMGNIGIMNYEYDDAYDTNIEDDCASSSTFKGDQ